MNKADWRERAKQELRKLSLAEKSAASAALCRQLSTTKQFASARVVLIFAPLPSEPDLLALIETAAAASVRWAAPRVDGEGLRVHLLESAADFVYTSKFLREPDLNKCPEIPVEQVDLMLIPGLAFDAKTMNRLGRGGGYYDRLLAAPGCRAFKLGVCFPSQIHSPLPQEPHDILMDSICDGTQLYVPQRHV
jgi:5-formyltetrahydrofolate cyclo-ligase